MKVSMDAAGRIVVPKPLRDVLGLGADSEFVVEVDGSGLRLQPTQSAIREIDEVDGWPVLRATPGPPLTDADVRTLRDATQR